MAIVPVARTCIDLLLKLCIMQTIFSLYGELYFRKYEIYIKHPFLLPCRTHMVVFLRTRISNCNKALAQLLHMCIVEMIHDASYKLTETGTKCLDIYSKNIFTSYDLLSWTILKHLAYFSTFISCKTHFHNVKVF